MSLFLITLITTVFYIVALSMLIYVRHDWDSGLIRGKLPMMIVWFSHATIYWMAISIARIFFGYDGPSMLVSHWGAFLYMQAPMTLIFAAWPLVKERMKQRKTDAP